MWTFNIENFKDEISEMSYMEQINFIDDAISELENLKTDITEQHSSGFNENVFSNVKKYIADNNLKERVFVIEERNNWYIEFEFKDETFQLILVQSEYEEPHLNISLKNTILDNSERNNVFKAIADAASLAFQEDSYDISMYTSEQDCADDICFILSKIY